MSIEAISDLPGPLATKIKAVSKARGYLVRRVTDEEAERIKSSDDWQNGWFKGPGDAQVVLERRECGQHILFRI